jgi:hypothetical protein
MKLSMASHVALLVIMACAAGTLGVAQSPPGAMPPQTKYGGGDGLSKQTAVIIRSGGEAAGTESEYSWIKAHYPGSTPISQALTPWDSDGKRYQRITVHTSSGDDVVIWFEISALFKG